MTINKYVVLIIEDEKPIRRFLKPFLESHDFKVIEADNAEEGMALASSHKPDLILLDLELPDLDGLVVLGRLREWTQCPIIILTCRDQERDKVKGLDAGADDYLTKPFDTGELLARIRVALRHESHLKTQRNDPCFETPDFKVDLASRIVTVRNQEVHLTQNEYKLLGILIRHAGKVVTQKMITREIWGIEEEEQASSLRLFIHQLRQKIEEDPALPQYILTEPGVGYRLKNEFLPPKPKATERSRQTKL